MSRYRLGSKPGGSQFNNLKADEVFSRVVGDQSPIMSVKRTCETPALRRRSHYGFAVYVN